MNEAAPSSRTAAGAHPWFESLALCATYEQVRALLLDVLVQAGFDVVASGEIDLAEPKRSLFYVNTWPQAWFDYYRRERIFESDPLFRRIAAGSGPFSWPEMTDLSERERVIIDAARQFGWIDGLAIPIPRGGTRIGIVSLAGANAVPEGEERRRLIGFATLAHERMRGLYRFGDVTANNAGLTRREIESLALVAQGLGDRALAEVLGISPATAHEHVERAKSKLGSRTRTHAVAVAVSLGLFQP